MPTPSFHCHFFAFLSSFLFLFISSFPIISLSFHSHHSPPFCDSAFHSSLSASVITSKTFLHHSNSPFRRRHLSSLRISKFLGIHLYTQFSSFLFLLFGYLLSSSIPPPLPDPLSSVHSGDRCVVVIWAFVRFGGSGRCRRDLLSHSSASWNDHSLCIFRFPLRPPHLPPSSTISCFYAPLL